jgi:hypothetical protein
MNIFGILLPLTFLTIPMFVLFIIFLSLLSKAFLIWMLIDCINRDEGDFENKTLWTILLALGFFFGYDLVISLVYYFTVKTKLDK